MSKFLAGVRRPALCAVSAASMLAGGITLWAMLDPETVRGASTPLLLGVLGLMTLPLLTLAAFETDRRNRAFRAALRREAAQRRLSTAIAALDIASIPEHGAHTKAREVETVARRHEGVGAAEGVSGRRAARSAPGRSRAAARR
ncbi:MAG: hypothetical protein ACTS27_05935 [Phycisphaerales bacterium]